MSNHISRDNLHPSMRSRRVRNHLRSVQVRIDTAPVPKGWPRREAIKARIDLPDFRLLDLLTAALDLADDEDLQMLIAYARTSLVIALASRDQRI